jgi:hypothetical protein
MEWSSRGGFALRITAALYDKGFGNNNIRSAGRLRLGIK